jgi:UDP-N-acetyl-D-glucosamine dehydrogenase
VRESPALDIIHLLQKRGARVTYFDPYVSSVRMEGGDELQSSDESSTADCTVIVTDHKAFDYRKLVDSGALIVDTRNALKSFASPRIIRL